MEPVLYMTELAVSDFAASVAWYRDALRLSLMLTDTPNQFALFRGRLAIKAGIPTPGGVLVHFQVDDLDAELARLRSFGVKPDGTVKTTAEGYRRAFVLDPDGYRIGLFAWATGR